MTVHMTVDVGAPKRPFLLEKASLMHLLSSTVILQLEMFNPQSEIVLAMQIFGH